MSSNNLYETAYKAERWLHTYCVDSQFKPGRYRYHLTKYGKARVLFAVKRMHQRHLEPRKDSRLLEYKVASPGMRGHGRASQAIWMTCFRHTVLGHRLIYSIAASLAMSTGPRVPQYKCTNIELIPLLVVIASVRLRTVCHNGSCDASRLGFIVLSLNNTVSRNCVVRLTCYTHAKVDEAAIAHLRDGWSPGRAVEVP